MPYRLRTFGGLDLRNPDGTPAEALLAQSKGMALLVYLAVEAPGEGVGRGAAAELLWPDREEERARSALRVALTRLRQATDAPLVEGKGESILRPSRERLEVDVWEFREALDCGDVALTLSLYGGDFLPGNRVPIALPFERLVDRTREDFRDDAYEAALAAGRAAREAGDLEEAVSAYQRGRELRPLREPAAVELVRALAEDGRSAEALQRYEAYRSRREEELDLAPSEEFEALVERIRAGEINRGTPEPSGLHEAAVPSMPEDAARVDAGADAARPGTEMDRERGGSASGDEAGDVTSMRRPAGTAVAALLVAAVGLALWHLSGSDGIRRSRWPGSGWPTRGSPGRTASRSSRTRSPDMRRRSGGPWR